MCTGEEKGLGLRRLAKSPQDKASQEMLTPRTLQYLQLDDPELSSENQRSPRG